MAWVKIDDRFDENPKIAAIGPLGIAMYVTGLAYANRTLTDGYIPEGVAHRLITCHEISIAHGMHIEPVTPLMVIASLVENRLWKRARGGYQIHDYLKFQPSKEQILAEREAAKKRMQNFRNSRGSPEQTTNEQRTSPEVQAKFEGSTAAPVTQEEIREAAAATSREDQTPAAPAASAPAAAAFLKTIDEETGTTPAESERLHKLGVLEQIGWSNRQIQAIADEAELDRAYAWAQLAQQEANTNPGGYTMSGYRTGDWPGERTSSNSQAQKPLIEIATAFVRGPGHHYPDEAILDELGIMERKRGEQFTEAEREQVLGLAGQLRGVRTEHRAS